MASQNPYTFTESQDWFSHNISSWRTFLPLITNPHPRALEIGSWEGRSAVFLLTELCAKGGEVVCIDHFDSLRTRAGRERLRTLRHNLARTGNPRYRIIPQFSVPGLMTLLAEEAACSDPHSPSSCPSSDADADPETARSQGGFDWVYVDGSHEADDTLLDGELAWRLARRGAVVVFDDYRWDRFPEDSAHHPKRGVDAFLALHAGEYVRLSPEGAYQLVLQKKTDMRIGFLVQPGQGAQEEKEQGIAVAMVFDDAYAVGAAVAMRSAAVYTSGHVTFYVVEDYITDDVKAKLEASIADRTNATIRYIHVPTETTSVDPGPAIPGGPMWGKIVMLPHLPVERVLYLDADVLVRDDLKDLWDTDLGGKALAAAPDVGFPNGHDDLDSAAASRPYFNAGVLLLDLARVREDLPGLFAHAAKCTGKRLGDQDALNLHFGGAWRALGLRWNAQGLGTYARAHTPARDGLDLAAMADPAVVHFTGALHPRLEDVVNPFVQPYCAKPWGYAGAPGHPFAEEWWAVCEETAWKGWRASEECREEWARKQEDSVRLGLEVFVAKLPSA